MNFPDIRMQRLRQNKGVRKLLSKQLIRRENIIFPVFVIDGHEKERGIVSLPQQKQVSVDRLPYLLEPIVKKGIGGILIFAAPKEGKDATGSLSLSSDGIVPRSIKKLKKEFPELPIFTDLCLCGYTNHGHCGPIDQNGNILNDKSIELLSNMALLHAEHGATGVAPSAMMDGQVCTIRKKLDSNDFKNTLIMSYSTKFASNLYGPFRDAAGSSPSKGDRKSYQAPFYDTNQALRESFLDEQEGADILMVKPALFYLDIIVRLRENTRLPIAAYNVSGEFKMIYDYCQNGFGDMKSLALESLTAIKRAGADIVITYWPGVIPDILDF